MDAFKKQMRDPAHLILVVQSYVLAGRSAPYVGEGIQLAFILTGTS
jgi:hypothetical protein